jgi:hypothetical protein
MQKIFKEINEISDYFSKQGDFETMKILAKTKKIIKQAENPGFDSGSNVPPDGSPPPLPSMEKLDLPYNKNEEGAGIKDLVLYEIIEYLKKKVEHIKNAKVRIVISKLIIFLESQLLKKEAQVGKIYKYAQAMPQLLQYNLGQLVNDQDPNIRNLATQIVNSLTSRMQNNGL